MAVIEKVVIRLKRGDMVRTIDGRYGVIVGGEGYHVKVNVGMKEKPCVITYILSEVCRTDIYG